MMPVFKLGDTAGRHPTVDKILSFANLKSGWRYGAGMPFDASVILNAISLLRTAIISGLSHTDAFPGKEGNITVACYDDDNYYGFRVDRDGKVRFLHEKGLDEIACVPGLSLEKAKQKIKTLTLPTWNWYVFSTSPITTRIVADLQVNPSKVPVKSLAVEFQFSEEIVPWKQAEAYVIMPEHSIPESLMNRQFSGDLIPTACPLGTA